MAKSTRRKTGLPPLTPAEYYRLLPGVLREIADSINPDVALKLAQAYGGTRIYIPTLNTLKAKRKDAHPLESLLGKDAALMFCRLYGGEGNFRIPKATRLVNALIRRGEIERPDETIKHLGTLAAFKEWRHEYEHLRYGRITKRKRNLEIIFRLLNGESAASLSKIYNTTEKTIFLYYQMYRKRPVAQLARIFENYDCALYCLSKRFEALKEPESAGG